jgi:putative transposase
MVMSHPYYVRPLKAKERRELDQLCRQPPNARVYQRSLAVLLSSEGKTTHEIGRVVRRDHSTVFRWLKRFDAVGVAACTPGKSSGRPPKIDADAKQTLREAVVQNPRDLGYSFTRWTTSLLVEHLARMHHLTVHPATVAETLRGLGYRYGCPKLDLKHRQDPTEVARAKRQRNRALKKRLPTPTASPFSISTKPSFT